MGEECDGQIPEAAVLTNVGAELTFQLPFNTSDRFVSLFTEFDDHKKELGITTYGVSVTLLTHSYVFEHGAFQLLRVARLVLYNGQIVPHAELVLQIMARSAREHLTV